MASLDWTRDFLPANRRRQLALLLLDSVVIVFAVFFALLMRYQLQLPSWHFLSLLAIAGAALLAKITVFVRLGVYRTSLSHIGLKDMTRILEAVSMGSVLFAAISQLLRVLGVGGLDLPTLVTDYLLSLMLLGGLRVTKRVVSEVSSSHPPAPAQRALVVGAGSAGELTLRALLREKGQECLPVALVDDDPAKDGMTIHGVPVLGKRWDIPSLVAQLAIHELIIAMPSAHPSVLKETEQLGRRAGLKRIRVLPRFCQLINGGVSTSDLRDLQIEDLLHREPIQLDTQEIESYLKDKVVLVTGGAGSVGSELCQQVASFQPEQLVVVDQDETGLFQLRQGLSSRFPHLNLSVVVGDIQDRERMLRVFARFRPRVVFHSAAYKHVGMMEENPEEAVRNNVLGTWVTGEAASLYGAEKFVLISTDKAVRPTCVMGATKRLAEMVVQHLDQRNSCRFVAVRFGNVLGTRGSVVPIFRTQIEHGGPVTVTHPDMRRYFMTPSEAALLVLQAGAIGCGGEVFVLDMGTPVAIVDLARDMIRLAGLEPGKDIPIVFTNPCPGEKLFEDILTAEEGTGATRHRRICVAKPDPATSVRNGLGEALENLQALIGQGNAGAIVAALHALVPTYCPSDRWHVETTTTPTVAQTASK